jgi:DNA mismatch endonuclease (patch repair protein)
MADRLSSERRSWLMGRIGSRHTSPEFRVRRMAHALGYRFRLHRKDLPGTPDLVFPRFGLALFVHGCFWHRHSGCCKATLPKSRAEYWLPKLARNVERDRLNQIAVEACGWRVAVIWECETKDPQLLRGKLLSIIAQS